MGGMAFPIFAAKISYESIVDFVDSLPIFLSPEELDGYVGLTWKLSSSSAEDHLDTVIPSKEAILEAMTGVEIPRDDLHHRSYFIPDL